MSRARTLALALVLLTFSVPAAGATGAPDPVGAGLADALRDLDARELRTGILYDRVLPLARAERFDGRAGAPAADAATWRQLYDELRRAANDPGVRPPLEEVVAGARARAEEGVVPLALLDLPYERLRPDALARGALVARGGRLERGPGEAYAGARAVALAALRERTWRGASVRFALDPERLFTAGDAPRRFEADLDDGLGFRALRPGEALTARYASPGERTLRVRAWRAGGAVDEAAARFTVAALQAPTPDDTIQVTASVPYLGVQGTGRAYVWLGAGHTRLEDPIVMSEGFDLYNDMGWDELYALLDQQGLADSLHARGFDAVVLDFTDATDYVQRNALVVAQLVQQVEAAIDPAASIAVVGPSMGGLCTRYALAWLESQGPGHRARTWISFDAPHEGADIPLGIQYWMQFFAGQSASAAELLARLNTPAARQMLVYHLTSPPGATGEPDPLRAGLLADFAAVGGWPQLPRRVAIADGSGAARDQGFAPGDQLIQYSYSNLFVTILGNVWAVPDQASHTIFDGRIRILLSDTRETVTVQGTAPYDGAPGGWRSSMMQMDTTQAPYGDIVALHPDHCFIPTVSALALDVPDLFHDVLADTALLAHTPFDAVHVPLENLEHVTITPEIAGWLVDELGRGLVGVGPGPAASMPALRAAPSPFRRTVRLAFDLPRAAAVDLRVFGVDGREVAMLARGARAAGTQQAEWDGRDAAGRPVPAGLYFARLEADGRVSTRRLVRVR